MTTAYTVTGLGFGDESKGSTTDYLARQGSTVVVRHNGGPQAGHNVVTSDGRQHEFAQFGSGTFAGAKTFLSRFMMVNPLNQTREAAHLAEIGETDILSRTYVDENAIVVTPWHAAINRLQEVARGDNRHGSCGQGVGAAALQALDPRGLTVRVKNIPDGGFWPRLEAMRRYLMAGYAHLLDEGSSHWQFLEDGDSSQYLADRFQAWAKTINVVPSDYLAELAKQHEQVVFEGAQGVLLDEWFGTHPYTTWSTTTDENALTLLREIDPQIKPIRLGVIRAVTTRHGAGPLPTYSPVLTKDWKEPHNIHGEWQGAFRVGHLDLALHNYALRTCGGVDHIVISHLDRQRRWKYCAGYEGVPRMPLGRRGDLEGQERLTRALMQVQAEPYRLYMHSADQDLLLEAVAQHLAPVWLTSHGPTAEDKQAHTPVAVP